MYNIYVKIDPRPEDGDINSPKHVASHILSSYSSSVTDKYNNGLKGVGQAYLKIL
jgi:hypothetical protein